MKRAQVSASVLAGMVASLCVSCGGTSGFIRDASTSNDIHYDAGHGFRFLRSVSAAVSTDDIFCLMPTGPAPYATVMEELQKKAALQPGQTILNLREDRVLRVFIIFCTTNLTVSGDVYEFERVPAAAPPTWLPVPVPGASPAPAASPNSAPTPTAPPSEPNPFQRAPF